jgi:hypothetical protein
MERMHKTLVLVATASTGLLLSACMAGGPTRAERLATFQAHAGAPVDKVRYFNPIGWDELDDEHIVVTMRPSEQYLMRLSGPCLQFSSGVPVIAISSTAGYVSTKFDRVTASGSTMSCRIEEIRPLDVAGLRADQASGT